jgi:hypothetical protein
MMIGTNGSQAFIARAAAGQFTSTTKQDGAPAAGRNAPAQQLASNLQPWCWQGGPEPQRELFVISNLLPTERS